MTNNPYANVVLGFLEKASPEDFAPDQFCSKTGGTPVWLHRTPHPAPKPPVCPVCVRPQAFLLQVYAPIEDDAVGHPGAFHRFLYVTICRTPSCARTGSAAQGVTVLRAQMPRRNDAYAFNAGDVAAVPPVGPLCALCGFGGELKCGACRRVRYCSRGCQAEDWKLGHRAVCVPPGEEDPPDEAKEAMDDARASWRFPEMEIVTDRHPSPENSDIEDDDDDDDEDDDDGGGGGGGGENGTANPSGDANGDSKVHANGDEAANGKDSDGGDGVGKEDGSAGKLPVEGTFQDADEEELPEELFQGREGVVKDKVFSKFNKVVSCASDQVIRYERDGRPLWGGANNQCADSEIPKCPRCGARRVFEMQVMPQMIYLLDCEAAGGEEAQPMSINEVARRFRDDMDWATVAVFTCEKSCRVADGEYVEEFAWIQRHR